MKDRDNDRERQQEELEQVRREGKKFTHRMCSTTRQDAVINLAQDAIKVNGVHIHVAHAMEY